MSVQIQDYHRQILHGDVMDKLKEIPTDTFDCIITSPPYWQLRDYSDDGQWGLEPTYQEYLAKMGLLMDELKRVLKNTGSCFINIGDTYGSHKSGEDKLNPSSIARKPIKNLEKSRVGIPERFYINCIDSGWIARNNIPWIKWNAMPQSIKDRFTNKWEAIYFFVKNKKYYFNLDAVRIQTQNDYKSFAIHVRDHFNGYSQQKLGEMKSRRILSKNEIEKLHEYNRDGTKKIQEKYTDKDSNVSRLHKDREGNPNNKQDETLGSDGKPKVTYEGFNDRWKNRKYQEQTISKINSNNHNIETGESLNHPKGKNPGDLTFEVYSDEEILEWIKLCRDDPISWELAPPDLFFINPKPMPDAHFATFPIALPQRILKCACPKKVCIKCGHIPTPIKKPTENYQKILDAKPWKNKKEQTTDDKLKVGSGLNSIPNFTHDYCAEYIVVDYTKCDCNDEFIPGIVLDPFFGAGTTGVAAELEGIRWCGIELKEEYSTIARRRLNPYVTQGSLGV